MISYEPLWETMKRKKASTYTLQVKGEISSSTVRRLKANESVSTNTLDALCKILECEISDIIKFHNRKQTSNGLLPVILSNIAQALHIDVF